MMKNVRPDSFRIAADAERPEDIHSPPLINLQRVGIEVENATLRYPIGPYVRGSLKSQIFGLIGHRDFEIRAEFVNAFSGLNLTISHGEKVGIIGSNGSGKSSLLRALAGVYPLTEGSITVKGEIGTLLDIGLGFEVEATGRENIYYRGMAMGYSRAELRRAEAQIVDFAGLGEFINLPMRTYSSGMYVRLGFAVSTHFSPDILLVDEVFGAGDAGFTERALERMSRIVSQSGIVVMAAHDMALVERLCTRVVWINRGSVVRDGPAALVIQQFKNHFSGGQPLEP